MKGRNFQNEHEEYMDEYNRELAIKIEQERLDKIRIRNLRLEYKDMKEEYLKNIYELENSSDKLQMDLRGNNINDPINDAYLPYHNTTSTKEIDVTSPEYNINKYKIINLYKELLVRQPTDKELIGYNTKIMNGLIDLKDLKRLIVNSDEYTKIIKLQSNIVNPGLLYSTMKDNINSKIAIIYQKEMDEEIPKKLLGPLKDIYHYFQYNEYLFRALLVNTKFTMFKEEVIIDSNLKRDDIIKLYKNYFDEQEIKEKANDIVRYDKYNRVSENDGNTTEEPYDDRYESVSSIDDSTLPDFRDLILRDDSNYFLWNRDTQDEVIDSLSEAQERIAQQRRELSRTAEQIEQIDNFTNFPKIPKPKKYFNNDKFKLLSNEDFNAMTEMFSNKV